MTGTYSPWLVLASVLVAMFVSYTALNLSARVAHEKEHSRGSAWLGVGALAMGCGIWSMHFIGMLAFSLPIPLAYDISITLASLVIAVAISGFALLVASNPQLSVGQLSVAAVIMGIGISAMHYTGMAGILIVPMITYEMHILVASVVIAIVASFAALWLFFQLRHGRSLGMRLARVGAAFVMGLAISGMHYTGMAASQFSAQSICTTTASVDTHWLAIAVTVVAMGVLSTATIMLMRNPVEAQAAR
jgi:NO-binding membrane sensor protein with MHYT domain